MQCKCAWSESNEWKKKSREKNKTLIETIEKKRVPHGSTCEQICAVHWQKTKIRRAKKNEHKYNTNKKNGMRSFRCSCFFLLSNWVRTMNWLSPCKNYSKSPCKARERKRVLKKLCEGKRWEISVAWKRKEMGNSMYGEDVPIEAESLGVTFKWKFTLALRLSITVYPSASLSFHLESTIANLSFAPWSMGRSFPFAVAITRFICPMKFPRAHKQHYTIRCQTLYQNCIIYGNGH